MVFPDEYRHMRVPSAILERQRSVLVCTSAETGLKHHIGARLVFKLVTLR